MSIISKIEQTFFSQEIRSDTENRDRAWVLFLTCFGAGLSCALVIIIAFFDDSHDAQSLLIVAVGHSLVLSCVSTLRFAQNMVIPSWCIGSISTAQLIIASLVTGALHSNVIYGFPILPIFLVLIGGRRIALISGVILGLGIIGFYIFPTYNHESGSELIHISTMLWAIASGIFIAGIAFNREQRHRKEIFSRFKDEQEMQRQILRLLSERDLFWAMMSHELRNSLSVLFAIADLLEKPQSNEKKEIYLFNMKKSCNSLHRFLEQVLEFSRIGSKQFSLQPKSVNLTAFLTDIVEESKVLAHQKDLYFKSEFLNVAQDFYTDDLRLQQVFSNLIGNAIKYTQNGGVTLSVKFERDTLYCTVKDTGPGISPEFQEVMFDPYQRGNHKQRGIGLGLVIVDLILKYMNTKARVYSTSEGTRVDFDIKEYSQGKTT